MGAWGYGPSENDATLDWVWGSETGASAVICGASPTSSTPGWGP